MKNKFRKEILEKRLTLPQEYIEQKSSEIISNLMTLDCIQHSNCIMTYLDFRNEVSTDALVRHFFNQRIQVCCPITDKNNRELIPVEIHDLENDIHLGTYNIREPKDLTHIVPLNKIDVVIVPLVAASLDGYRLGYGGGYYDRFLRKLRPDLITIGLSYEMQLFESIPIEEHDIRLDYIVTENKIIKK